MEQGTTAGGSTNVDDHQYLLEKFTRLSAAAEIAAAYSNHNDVRATFANLALRWKALADLMAPNRSIWRGASTHAMAVDLVEAAREDTATLDVAASGISCVSTHYFRYKTFRYTTLEDAVAQAERDLPLSSLATSAMAIPVVVPSMWAKRRPLDPGTPNSAHEWT